MSVEFHDPYTEPPAAPGPATGLFKSLGNLVNTVLTMVQTRLELVTTELQEEVHRVAQLLVFACIAMVCGLMAALFIALTIVFAFWDTHRVLASVCVTFGFIVIAAVAFGLVRTRVKGKPRLLDATLTELARDRDELRSHLDKQS